MLFRSLSASHSREPHCPAPDSHFSQTPNKSQSLSQGEGKKYRPVFRLRESDSKTYRSGMTNSLTPRPFILSLTPSLFFPVLVTLSSPAILSSFLFLGWGDSGGGGFLGRGTLDTPWPVKGTGLCLWMGAEAPVRGLGPALQPLPLLIF